MATTTLATYDGAGNRLIRNDGYTTLTYAYYNANADPLEPLYWRRSGEFLSARSGCPQAKRPVGW